MPCKARSKTLLLLRPAEHDILEDLTENCQHKVLCVSEALNLAQLVPNKVTKCVQSLKNAVSKRWEFRTVRQDCANLGKMLMVVFAHHCFTE